MKNRLALKFILAYAVFGVLAFALVAVFGSRLCLRAALRSASDELYREARTIASASRRRARFMTGPPAAYSRR